MAITPQCYVYSIWKVLSYVSAARAGRGVYAYAYATHTVMCPSHDRGKCEVSKNKMASAAFGRNVLVLGASDNGAINVTLDSPQTIKYIKNRLQYRTVC